MVISSVKSTKKQSENQFKCLYTWKEHTQSVKLRTEIVFPSEDRV